MKNRDHARDTEKVVQHVLKTVAKYNTVGKAEFELILSQVIQQVQKNTGLEPDKIARMTEKVIQDMPNEYGQLSEAARSWEALIAYLYNKYLKELGVFKSANQG